MKNIKKITITGTIIILLNFLLSAGAFSFRNIYPDWVFEAFRNNQITTASDNEFNSVEEAYGEIFGHDLPPKNYFGDNAFIVSANFNLPEKATTGASNIFFVPENLNKPLGNLGSSFVCYLPQKDSRNTSYSWCEGGIKPTQPAWALKAIKDGFIRPMTKHDHQNLTQVGRDILLNSISSFDFFGDYGYVVLQNFTYPAVQEVPDPFSPLFLVPYGVNSPQGERRQATIIFLPKNSEDSAGVMIQSGLLWPTPPPKYPQWYQIALGNNWLRPANMSDHLAWIYANNELFTIKNNLDQFLSFVLLKDISLTEPLPIEEKAVILYVPAAINRPTISSLEAIGDKKSLSLRYFPRQRLHLETSKFKGDFFSSGTWLEGEGRTDIHPSWAYSLITSGAIKLAVPDDLAQWLGMSVECLKYSQMDKVLPENKFTVLEYFDFPPDKKYQEEKQVAVFFIETKIKTPKKLPPDIWLLYGDGRHDRSLNYRNGKDIEDYLYQSRTLAKKEGCL